MSADYRPVISERLVRQLVAKQFPQWTDLSVRPVVHSGWDNRSFRLGDDLLVRLPTAAVYALQVEKEQRWLPMLAPSLPLPIPTPVSIGAPGKDYPWRWSIYRWLEGDTAAIERIANLSEFARGLAEFLNALQHVDAFDGPPPGQHNFYRGGSLATYDAQTRQAIEILKHTNYADAAAAVWETARASRWQKAPVWIHGDVSPGNLLVRDGRLSALIDFGNCGVGDPACDLAIAWTFFDRDSRRALHDALSVDAGTWARGRGWALWKALILETGLSAGNPLDLEAARSVIRQVLEDK